ncbi:hypothetical protein amrb99_38780 [Actinomadura sp. RB99]|uniref:PrsW family glutamic-type intramembrane protease n=1 Tax=Actinomadura sp. RB99 TaxID=2691577 RepID=UPI001689C9E1|nr:PrsW family glutamic-type intramembrane protease [Actinomadura sp. RB99]MBD2894947.1 hypothetical protein [Actinomadura sp. RB99]
MQPTTSTAGRPKPWLRVFWAGLALWAASVLVTVVTANANLLPTIVLLGSFLVPVTFVVWAYEHGTSGEVTVPLLFRAFVVGGVLGVLGASLLERYLLHPSLWRYFGVGFIEEAVKVAALLYVARHLRARTLRDGLVLGATVGFGFAAFALLWLNALADRSRERPRPPTARPEDYLESGHPKPRR